MATNRDSTSTGFSKNQPKEAETIVHINDNGRIVIPRDIRRILGVTGTQAKVTVYHEGNSATGFVEIDEFGRATIPIQLRRYLGINNRELDLQVEVARISVNRRQSES